MSIPLLVILGVAALAAMLIERSGVRTTLELTFKGDVKRESQWLAQYGQGVCTVVAAVLVWRLDPSHGRHAIPLLVATFGAALVAMLIKRLVGRVRPRRERAGQFLGPSLRHDNARESFPSSHSAAAVAMSVYLSLLYPAGAEVFWTLAIGCALLRYVLDAHWPSDVLAGIALGYAAAHVTWNVFALPR